MLFRQLRVTLTFAPEDQAEIESGRARLITDEEEELRPSFGQLCTPASGTNDGGQLDGFDALRIAEAVATDSAEPPDFGRALSLAPQAPIVAQVKLPRRSREAPDEQGFGKRGDN